MEKNTQQERLSFAARPQQVATLNEYAHNQGVSVDRVLRQMVDVYTSRYIGERAEKQLCPR
jgi:hypothetical protein